MHEVFNSTFDAGPGPVANKDVKLFEGAQVRVCHNIPGFGHNFDDCLSLLLSRMHYKK